MVRATWRGTALAGAAALSLVVLDSALTSGQKPAGDRVAALNQALAQNGRTLARDPNTGYLRSVLDALGVPVDSQLLVFSKTGVQRAYTGPRNPRALYFDQSVAVGYAPGAPVLELAAHDPQQGVVFYTLDQSAAAPTFTRRTSCLTCHVSASTLGVPGLIARSNMVSEDGNVLPQTTAHDVDHRTPHTDRWGGWFVTAEGAAPPYQQLGHGGNITLGERGSTSNLVFVNWLDSSPETHGYLLPSSDIVGLMVFDHQVHAINLMTKLNRDSRAAAPDDTRRLTDELADYLLFVDEAPPSAPLTPRPGFAKNLEARTPKDRKGRSFGQLDAVNRLLRYPCSYMVYSDAFDGLLPAIKQAVYRRMLDTLSADDRPASRAPMAAADRRAVLEILRDTKPDFPR
jgi:hypothetical protein